MPQKKKSTKKKSVPKNKSKRKPIKRKPKKVNRSSKSGRFVTDEFTRKNPDTTETERLN